VVIGLPQSSVLVCVGELDPITPVAAAEEMAHALPEGRTQLEVITGAGHFPWNDAPELDWSTLELFLAQV
jgi:pimeloyl-ACP methyl ester carboxylesterase